VQQSPDVTRGNALARLVSRVKTAMAHNQLLFAILLVLAALGRAIVQLAYQPALLFSDSAGYLYNAEYLVPLQLRPAGYAFFLNPLLAAHNLAVVAVAQHLLGLALGVDIYVLLVRLGLRQWVAALAAVPVLFDGFELDIEQYVMSDTLFELLLLAGLMLLVLPRRRLGHWQIAAAGMPLAFAGIVRFDGIVLVSPAFVFWASR
jgi:dolichyl-phosphate-mannose-protein mannosyltransferase